MKKTIYSTAVALLLAGALFAQPTQTPAPSSTPAATADPVIMKFGTTEIRQSEFESAIKTLPPEYQAYASSTGKRNFAEDYVRMKLLASEGQKNGLENDPDVQKQLKLLRENTLANAQLQRIEKGLALSEAELKAAYEEKKQTFDQAKARHILIAFKGSPALQPGKKELTEEEAKTKAEELRKKIVAGTDFAEVAKAESDDSGSGARGGDLGTFGRGQMVPEFDKAVFETKVGEVGPVIRTQYGYHIIQVQERKASGLEDVKAQLEQEIRQKKLQAALESMNKTAGVTFDEKYFAPEKPQSSEAAEPAKETPKAATKPARKP